MGKFGGLRARVTPHMTEVLTAAVSGCDLPDCFRKGVEECDGQYIEVAQIRQLCQSANDANPGSVSLHDVMTGSELSMAPLPQRQRNPELVARLERIKASLAHKEYDEMVGNVASKVNQEASLGQQYRELSVQTTVVFNSFLTVIGAFVFAFFAVRYMGLDFVAQMSAGLFVAMVVFFADLYFIMRNEIGKERGVAASTKASLAGQRTTPASSALQHQQPESLLARKR